MTYNSGIPYMCDSQCLYSPQYLPIEITHFAASVLFNGTAFLTGLITVTKQSGEDLIYNNFFHLCAWCSYVMEIKTKTQDTQICLYLSVYLRHN
jgi:hypothetical protein